MLPRILEKKRKCKDCREFYGKKFLEQNKEYKEEYELLRVNIYSPLLFEGFQYKKHQNERTKFDDEFCYSQEAQTRKKRDSFYTNDREKNSKKAYELCVSRLKEYEIEIVSVEKDPEGYNRTFCSFFIAKREITNLKQNSTTITIVFRVFSDLTASRKSLQVEIYPHLSIFFMKTNTNFAPKTFQSCWKAKILTISCKGNTDICAKWQTL
jgi:hypothetical protein